VASIGQGVNKDAAVPALRLTYYTDTHADAQRDQVNYYAYDLSKVWACMGRVGVNGVMRDGLVEVGDPFNGWAACTIEEVVGGVPVAVQRWNSLVGYNPLGGLAANDFCLFGSLSPFDDLLLHLDAGLGAQPAFVAEYWNGAAWAVLGYSANPPGLPVLPLVPDFTCAGGILNQRARWTLPNNWAAATPAQIGLPGLANPGTYYYMRLKLINPLGAGPLANQLYKDFLDGYIKDWYCHFGLKRGDDGTGANPTGWYEPGDFVLRFRDGFSLEGRTNVGGGCSWGKEVTTPTSRPTLDCGGSCIVSPGKGPIIWGGLLAGVMFMGKPRFASHNQVAAIRSNVDVIDIHGCLFMGCFSAQTPLGAGGPTAIRRITNTRFTIHPLTDLGVPIGYVNPFTISSAGDSYVDRCIFDVRPTASVLYVVRNTVSGQVRIAGLHFTDDAAIVGGANSGQLYLTGGGTYDLVGIDWGGPNYKVDSGIAFEWRMLSYTVRLDGTNTPLVGIPVRFKTTAGVLVQDVFTDANGKASYQGPGIGIQNEDLFAAGEWPGAGAAPEQLNDEFLTVEINPVGHASFNPTYASQTILARFPRAVLFDEVAGNYLAQDWQRCDLRATVALPLAVVAAGSTPIMVDDLPLPLGWEQRIEAAVPESI